MTRSRLGLTGAGEWASLESLIPDVAGLRILDLGCGFGWHAAYFAKHGALNIDAVDISARVVAHQAFAAFLFKEGIKEVHEEHIPKIFEPRKLDETVYPHQEHVKIFVVVYGHIRPPEFVAEVCLHADIYLHARLFGRLAAVFDELRHLFALDAERHLLESVVGYGDLFQPLFLCGERVFENGTLAVAVCGVCVVIARQ